MGQLKWSRWLSAHAPQRPTWVCPRCQREWPCPPARLQLRARAGNRIALAVQMANYLYLAIGDLTISDLDLNPEDLYDRFVGWTRYRPD
ncbi:hypothetical protein [Micromonospora sp. NPDC049679]|uniref:hypothetical protein n=1 Tax=Micromonospora sp. NPDC049679 TaxID=3155920 RepID=UPI0033DF0199